MPSVTVYIGNGAISVPDMTLTEFEQAVSAARVSSKEFLAISGTSEQLLRLDMIAIVEAVPDLVPEQE